jgi:uncharacterized protein
MTKKRDKNMSETKTPNKKTLLTFPCDFTIKVFGLANDNFETTVLLIIQKYIPHLTGHTVTSRTSENGKYLALSITISAESQEQLDNIYRDLSSSPAVLMAI